MTSSIPSAIPLPPAAAASADTYTDSNGLAALKANPQSPQALHAVAQQVDALFLQMMLKSMRDASADAGEASSNELGMYQDMFDKQISLNLSQHQGLGLGSLLARQMAAAQGSTADAGAPAAGTPAPAVQASGAAASTAAPAAIAADATDFVSQVLPSIRQAARTLGVDPLGLLAQAALETGWGKRLARTADGAPSFNLFGVKAGEGWSGARAPASTLEFKDGVATRQRSVFRAYDSVQASVGDFAALLQKTPRFREALAAGGDAAAYIAGIGRAGYATDPDYVNKLNEILHGDTLRAALKGAAAVL